MESRGSKRSGLFLVFGLGILAFGCGSGGEEESAQDPELWEGDIAVATRPLRAQGGTEEDWEAMKVAAAWAWDQGLDTVPFGEAIARMGLSFVGTPYAPGTLELAGEEDVVINFQELDCVTFVENVLALSRFIRLEDRGVLESDLRTRDSYTGFLREIRYRAGRVDGYPSRLHYFTDWLGDNESRGLLREITQELGGDEDYKALDFMSMHPESYRQLADPANLQAILRIEYDLTTRPRFKILEDEIPTWASWIQNGDIIAATSTVEGLDVAHTGLALWQDGALHLLHAPLVGDSVEVSRLPLAERIFRLERQDGIRVARPLDPVEGAGGGSPE